METYLLKFSACLVIFWLVYILFLERQTMHRFKRFYLIGTVVLALVIPVFTITHYIEPTVTDFEMSPVFIPIETSFVKLSNEQPSFMDIETAFRILYGLGVLLFTLRFGVNLFKMYKRISDNETLSKHSFIYVLLEECRIPHSFFKYIFFSKLKYKSDTIPKEVLLHEETHAKQLHSLDIIIIELLQIVFWFHPLVYVLKHHIKLNHEFLADQAVLEQGSDPKTYQYILLQFSSSTQDYQLSSAINYSSIKKRFTIMKTQTSKTRNWVSSLLLLPIIAILFYSFAEHVEVVKKESDIIDETKKELKEVYEIEQPQEKPIMWILINRKDQLLVDDELGSLESIDDKLKKLAKDGKTGQLVSIKHDTQTSKGIIFKVEELVKLNKFKVASYNITPIMSVLINKKDQLLVDDEPSTLKSIENKLKKLAKQGESGRQVIIKHDKETSKDIISKVENLVRSNKFKFVSFDVSKIPPPPPPTHKRTKGGPNIEDTQVDSESNYMVKLSSSEKNKIYARSIDLKILNDNSYLIDGITATKRTFVDTFNQLHQDITAETRNKIMNVHVSSTREISKKETWFIYNSLQDYGFYRIVTPNQEINRAKGNTPFATESSFSTQQKATKKQITEYNAWAKKMNMAIRKAETSGNYPIIKKKDYDKYYNIYRNLMSETQRENAEAWPNIPPPPPPPSAPEPKVNKREEKLPPPPPPPTTIKEAQYKRDKRKTLNEIIKETPKGVESGYELLENGESHYFTVYKGKKTYYNKDGFITNKKGKILPPPPPSAPKPKIDNDNEDLPPPPPPPAPESTLDFVIRMAKTNAKFINSGKVITSDEAIELVKNNPKLNVKAEKTDTKQPMIYFFEKPILINDKVKSKIKLLLI
ncbi:M56 family metallopeptidase [uncultured Winogradskyella sp.]|uniref:M56 family metallopeptidase n=1 Tax=uncultured Winogradskyella sp. TaxID=395353 RepID=UPI00262778A8|nr:M56 family metallopeptidase [uncultured Winogradskyella sp.]